MPVRFDVITLFPEMFAGVLGGSILDRAARAIPDPAAPDDSNRVRPPVASYHLHQLRDFSADAKHGKVDRPPYGGGAGMVLQCQPLWDAVQHVETIDPSVKPHRIFLTPTGRPFTQHVAEELADKPRLLLICGHYEGFDQRVLDALREDETHGGLDEISVGDVVLSGGELPAMSLIDAVVRLLPGALGDADSHKHDSFSPGVDRLLDHPHYTHPPTWQGREVPEVLRSGDHGKVAAWRAEQSRRLTETQRPDLLMGGMGSHSDEALAIAVVRESTDADRDAILTIHRKAFADESQVDRVHGLLDTHRTAISLVAEVAGDVVAHALVTDAWTTDEPGRRGWLALSPLAVRSPYRNRGLGTALVRQAIRESREVAKRLVWPIPSELRNAPFATDAWASALGFQPGVDMGLEAETPGVGLWVMRLGGGPIDPDACVAWP